MSMSISMELMSQNQDEIMSLLHSQSLAKDDLMLRDEGGMLWGSVLPVDNTELDVSSSLDYFAL